MIRLAAASFLAWSLLAEQAPTVPAPAGVSIGIVAPSAQDLVAGPTTITVAAEGLLPADRVEVFADGRRVASLTPPALTTTWDAGEAPRVHTITAALMRAKREIASTTVRTKDPGFVSRVTSRAVSVAPVVVDAEGHYVVGLTQKSFSVLDDGVPQRIETFETGDSPLSAVLVLDVSGSMLLKIEAARTAAHRFVDALKPDDEVSLMTFSSTVLETVAFTRDRARVHAAIDETRANGETAIYDVTAAALRKLKPIKRRKAVVLFTDGEDNRSRLSVAQVVDMARTSEVSIYAVAQGIDESKTLRVYLDRLANETGGRSYFIGTIGTLSATFDGIVSELRNQYFFTYTPTSPTPGTWHQVEVRVDRPGAVVRARKTYRIE